jgi:hypothetical protein
MSIDARVHKVLINPDGSGRLELIDRPARGGRTAGERGQANLDFQVCYPSVAQLVGCDVWGNDSVIMLGDMTIAIRTSPAEIRFVPRRIFESAVESFGGK